MTTTYPTITRMYQRRFGGPDSPPDEQGDCWATAVACFAGLTPADRNELHSRIQESDARLQAKGFDSNDSGAWWHVTNLFLAETIGLDLTVTDDPDENSLYIATGPSPRGDYGHTILAFGDGTCVWDPVSDGRGLPEVTEWVCWMRREAVE